MELICHWKKKNDLNLRDDLKEIYLCHRKKEANLNLVPIVYWLIEIYYDETGRLVPFGARHCGSYSTWHDRNNEQQIPRELMMSSQKKIKRAFCQVKFIY